MPPDLVAAVQAQRAKLAAVELPAHVDEASPAAARHAVGEAFVAGLRGIMVTCALLALACASVAVLFVRAEVHRALDSAAPP